MRKQHLDRGLEFLCDELHLYDRQEAAKHRMFFISAREALLKRNKDVTSSPRTGFAEGRMLRSSRSNQSSLYHSGHEQRLAEFDKFEHEFEKCISKAAVQTKFEQHTNRGKGILTSLRETAENIANQSQTYKQQATQKAHEMDQKNEFLERELRSMTESAKEKIRHISEDVYKRVAQTLNDEIKR